MINLAMFEGKVTKTPKQATTKNGKPVVELNLENISQSGQYQRKTYLNVTCYGRSADAARALVTGSMVTVQGQLTTWKDKDEKWHVGLQAQEIHGAQTQQSWDAVDADAPF